MTYHSTYDIMNLWIYDISVPMISWFELTISSVNWYHIMRDVIVCCWFGIFCCPVLVLQSEGFSSLFWFSCRRFWCPVPGFAAQFKFLRYISMLTEHVYLSNAQMQIIHYKIQVNKIDETKQKKVNWHINSCAQSSHSPVGPTKYPHFLEVLLLQCWQFCILKFSSKRPQD